MPISICNLVIYEKTFLSCGKLDKNVEKFRFANLGKLQNQKDT
jgi:hypothetical protein